ncbi:MAG: class I SAM-dependent methyltransferase [Alphaproteobacteria bacterium]|nr:class I SAM-dependent methyltransferase [Alphaproteobacteria bacterium]
MKTLWDYTDLAEAYLKRPDYSEMAIDQALSFAKLSPQALVCDVGAGVGHLTRMLLGRGYSLVAVEPNDEMRRLGIETTRTFQNVSWFEGTGEATGQAENQFDLVSFGSSFNVVDRQKALIETARILRPFGWFMCLWNHRDLDDPLQASVETLIKNYLPDYSLGSRREDQTQVIMSSMLFLSPRLIEGRIMHRMLVDDWIMAWRSHATLARQAGHRFADIIKSIAELVRGQVSVDIPYTTRLWIAQLSSKS